ncbi:Oncoprotein-induced transcript 3 protein [Desmophyllum pertusum]|uniref:Oncoprotein-induced transcript 3 protein n=1 Tax=Desmophyllum pertusum TaxID=174260 RepID=A0A9X0D1I7_9CNID|nr:Oncoprotein-induced transcript 3 protein [Desmophyllum pertusum]
MTRLSTLAILVVVLLLATLPEGQCFDPCVAYSTLNNPFRSTGYMARDGVDPMICDSKLKPGWYRFVNEVGGKMPQTKVDKYQCGTYAPIWMKTPHPTAANGTVDGTACINYNNMKNGCLSLAIKVKYCNINGTFYVYHLVPPFGCPMAYCAGMF